MSGLEWVIRVKIIVTVIFWAGPMLLVPRKLLESAGLPAAARPLARLLGWAYLALVVGYAYGLREVRAGRRARGTIAMGIVSNGGAAAYLTYFGVTGAWKEWDRAVQLGAWASAPVAFGIALGLWWFGVRENGGSRDSPGAAS